MTAPGAHRAGAGAAGPGSERWAAPRASGAARGKARLGLDGRPGRTGLALRRAGAPAAPRPRGTGLPGRTRCSEEPLRSPGRAGPGWPLDVQGLGPGNARTGWGVAGVPGPCMTRCCPRLAPWGPWVPGRQAPAGRERDSGAGVWRHRAAPAGTGAKGAVHLGPGGPREACLGGPRCLGGWAALRAPVPEGRGTGETSSEAPGVQPSPQAQWLPGPSRALTDGPGKGQRLPLSERAGSAGQGFGSTVRHDVLPVYVGCCLHTFRQVALKLREACASPLVEHSGSDGLAPPLPPCQR